MLNHMMVADTKVTALIYYMSNRRAGERPLPPVISYLIAITEG